MKLNCMLAGLACALAMGAPAGSAVAAPPPPQSPTLALPRERIVSNFGGWNIRSTNLSNGAATSSFARFGFVMNTDATNLRTVVVNGYADSTALLEPTGNAVNVHEALEISGNQLARVALGGASGSAISTGGRTGSYIGDGELVVSQPITGAVFADGSTQYLRQYQTVASGQKWPMIVDTSASNSLGVNTTDPIYGSSVTDGSDQSATFGAQSWGPNKAGIGFYFAPVAIIGEQRKAKPVHLIAGDSISAGYSGSWGEGYIGVGLIAGSATAYHNDGISGATCNNLAKYAQVPQFLARYVDYVHLHCGTNDIWTSSPPITNLASYQTVLLALVKAFGTASNKIWLYTLLPRNGSTDGFTTYTGQGHDSGCGQTGGTGCEDLRVTINNFLRDPRSTGAVQWLSAQLQAAGAVVRIAGVIDETPGVERNSDGSAVILDANGQQTLGTGGYWITNATANYYTPDGIHCKAPCENLLAPYVTGKVGRMGLF